ncbi:hypothetical protein I4U23_015604 [Adineta vaga]|nr:hypothetical protein I4U23_015604 [Adineta vaga]
MRSILILVLVAFTLSSTWARSMTINRQWKVWKSQFDKSYTNVEERLRRTIWEKNLELVEEHNRQADLGLHTYRLGMNQFADLTNKEFVQLLNGFHSKDVKEENEKFTLNPKIEIPDTVDWRDKGAVVPVKNQGQCGSSWAFSAVGSIEGLYAIKTGKLVSLSEQQLVDCSSKQGNMGCNGGLMNASFQYIQEAGGIEANESYPYKAVEKTCVFDASKVVVKLCGYGTISSGDEATLQQVVALIGPVATAVDAAHYSFQMYQSGVYDEPACSSTQPNHGIFIIGYGNASGKDYWLLKNSWDKTWGENGFIRMSRNKHNQCAVATMASYPILC